MKEEWKVFARGNLDRGDEVIKTLEDLGGSNPNHYYGNDNTGYYYINPNGEIAYASTEGSTAYPFLREFYREIKLQKWKPNYEEIYYFIASNGIIVKTVWYNTQDLRYEFGNCFRTYEDAEIARDKIKELLNKHK